MWQSFCYQVHTATLLTIYNRINSEWHSQSENGICDSTLVNLYRYQNSLNNRNTELARENLQFDDHSKNNFFSITVFPTCKRNRRHVLCISIELQKPSCETLREPEKVVETLGHQLELCSHSYSCFPNFHLHVLL